MDAESLDVVDKLESLRIEFCESEDCDLLER